MRVECQVGNMTNSLARLYAVLFRAIPQRELGEISLQIIIASHSAICCHDQQLLIFGPSKALDGAFIPADVADGLPSAAVDVDAGLRDLGRLIGYEFALIAVQSWDLVRIFP